MLIDPEAIGKWSERSNDRKTAFLPTANLRSNWWATKKKTTYYLLYSKQNDSFGLYNHQVNKSIVLV